MQSPHNYPNDMMDCLELMFGNFVDAESLRGVADSHSSTSKLQFAQGSVVVKSSLRSRERLFYERYREALSKHGVNTAQLYWSGRNSDNVNWIALEDVPGVFPQEQWRNNPQQVSMLFNLHAYSKNHILLGDDATWYRPKWDGEMTEQAFTWYRGEPQGDEIKHLLTNAQHLSQVLFIPLCCLSGDPNPTNWRVRQSGELVLLDWERFCEGHPAIDLAITMPNLGTQDLSLETQLARSYKRLWTDVTYDTLPSDSDFALQIRLAKIWSAVEFIANAVRDPDNYSRQSVDYIVAELPTLLHMLPLHN